jgi:hypothetical protein
MRPMIEIIRFGNRNGGQPAGGEAAILADAEAMLDGGVVTRR